MLFFFYSFLHFAHFPAFQSDVTKVSGVTDRTPEALSSVCRLQIVTEEILVAFNFCHQLFLFCSTCLQISVGCTFEELLHHSVKAVMYLVNPKLFLLVLVHGNWPFFW